MPFVPQSQFWPGRRAILLVHGIGDASTGREGAFPSDSLVKLLGDEAATVAKPLAIPSETRKGKTVMCTKDFISITGTHDPVGGHILGRRLDWAFMDIPGQHSIIASQHLLDIDTREGTAKALAHAFAAGGPSLKDPHSWTAYIETQAKVVRGLVLT
jgi:hypothetical protein